MIFFYWIDVFIFIFLDNLSVSSADGGGGEEEEDELENEPVRLGRTTKKSEPHNGSSNIHLLNEPSSSSQTVTRNSNVYSQSRQSSAGIRSINNVSFMSDTSKTGGKTIGTESTGNSSTNQLKIVNNQIIKSISKRNLF